MRTKLRNYVILLFTALLMLLGLNALPAGAASIKLYDEGKRLSEEEFRACEARIQEAADYTRLNVAVILGTGYRTDLTIESTCKATYTELFGARTDGLIYYMDLKGYSSYDYIATSGRAQFYYTNNSPDRISEMYSQIDPFLYPVGNEDVSGAVMKFCDELEYYYKQGVPEYYCVYDKEDGMYYRLEGDELIPSVTKPYRDTGVIVGAVFVSLLIGLFVAGAVYVGVKQAYQFKYELSPTTYVNRKNVEYREQYDNFTHTSTSRVHIDSGGSGRSGGGSHSHGVGHSSGGFGGGGHHR